ncbi:cold shock domain-containing protein [Streptomyces sp. NPDC005963]|uniref:cold-shock protein n=1 Tax=Streptomyces sp. NPDC005963 TaxID=3156721 RepID=UPI0033EA2A78
MTGKVLSFDDVRGYGFIAPDNGTDDVFMHANDLLDDKYLFRSGSHVEFEVEDGERGLKASRVRIVASGGGPTRAGAVAAPRPSTHHRSEIEDGDCDLLSAAEFTQEITEALLAASPSLTGEQILQVRRRIVELARTHNWVES